MATNASNFTYDDLVKLNNQRFVTLIPAVVLFSLYMLMGLVGNSLVCYIIGFKFQSNNQNFLIVWLAIFDLLSCLLAIPTDIVDMRFSYNFPSATACKILRFIMAFTCIGSAFVLTVIAIDRYRKICKPLAPQMTRTRIKVALTIALGIAICLSLPAPFIFGLRVFESPIEGIDAQDCSTSQEMKDTNFPMVYTGVLFLAFITLCVTLIALYCKILIMIKRHSREMRANSDASRIRPKDHSESELSTRSVTGDTTVMKASKSSDNEDHECKVKNSDDDECTSAKISQSEVHINNQTLTDSSDLKQESELSTVSISSGRKSSVNTITTKGSSQETDGQWNQKKPKSQKKSPSNVKLEAKTTKITFLITVVFILSFLPYLSLQIAKSAEEGFDYNLKGTPFLLQNIFLRSYYINSIANPIIYGVLNRRFRVEVKGLLCEIFFCKLK